MAATDKDAHKTPRPYTPPKPPKAPLTHGIGYHILCTILSSISFSLIFVAYISSATPGESTPGGLLASTPWLVHVNQTVESTTGLDGGADTKTLRRWGLGTFGWCEWNFNAVDMQQDGECVKKIGWVLPGSAETGDDILAVEMPAAIGGAMPIFSHFLIISALLILLYTLLLLLAFRRSPVAIKEHGIYALAKPREGQKKNFNYYHHLRGFRWGGLILSLALLPVFIVILCIAIGVMQVNKGSQGLVAEVGSAGYMLIGASVMIVFIGLMVRFGGLRVRKG